MKLTARVLLLTFVGGALGTALRWTLALSIPTALWSVALVNLLGAFAIGFFNGHRYFQTDVRRALYSIGFCGGFTTLSALMANVDSLANGAFVAAELALGIAVYLLGTKAAKGASHV